MPVDPLPFVEDVVPQYAVAITQLVYFVASFVAVYLLGRVFVRRCSTACSETAI